MEYARKDLIVGSRWEVKGSCAGGEKFSGCVLTIDNLDFNRDHTILGIRFSVNYPVEKTGSTKDWIVNELFFLKGCIKISGRTEKLNKHIEVIKSAL